MLFLQRKLRHVSETRESMEDMVSHIGVVEKVEGSEVTVLITRQHGCSQCGLSSHCNAAGTGIRRVSVIHPEGVLHPGQQVRVEAGSTVGLKAAWWAFGLPLLLMVAVALAVGSATKSDACAAVAGLASLVPYAVGLYLLRGRMGRRLTFRIV